MNWILSKEYDVRWEHTATVQCNSAAETKTSTKTETTSISDSYNTSTYKVNNLSDIGNVNIAPAAAKTGSGLILLVAVGFGLFLLLAFLRRRKN